jgi:SAM-dependent methyltransferase
MKSFPSSMVRKIYEKQPYPPVKRTLPYHSHLPPLRWMLRLDRAEPLVPQRILVAGCGTGLEALQLARKFKAAEIMGIDFSPHSIQLAQQQKKALLPSSRVCFQNADLSDPQFRHRVGYEPFDLIVCHGVLSYIPQPEAALRNLAQCLRRDGVFYLGVNGSLHFSASLRPVLAGLGYDLAQAPRDRRFRRVLQLWETLSERAGSRVPQLPDWYLAGDLFCPVIHNWPLLQWARAARKAGLYLRTSFSSVRDLGRALPEDRWKLMARCSPEDLCAILDLLSPRSFLALLLSTEKPPLPPWEDLHQLLRWRIVQTGLYQPRFPKEALDSANEKVMKLRSRIFNLRCQWPMPTWERRLLYQAKTTLSLEQALGRADRSKLRENLSGQLFLLWQLAVINLLPPG